MNSDETLLSGRFWHDTGDLAKDLGAIQEFETFRSVVYSLAVVVSADIEQLQPFVCGDRVSDHVVVALEFNFERLMTWVSEELLNEIKHVVQLRLRKHQEESALKAFDSSRSLVQLCLSGAHSNWKTANAQSLVEQLPSAAGGLVDVIGVVSSFAQV